MGIDRLAGVPHQIKCLEVATHVTREYEEHFVVGLNMVTISNELSALQTLINVFPMILWAICLLSIVDSS